MVNCMTHLKGGMGGVGGARQSAVKDLRGVMV